MATDDGVCADAVRAPTVTEEDPAAASNSRPGYHEIHRFNKALELYYRQQCIFSDEEELQLMLATMREQLPATFRFTFSHHENSKEQDENASVAPQAANVFGITNAALMNSLASPSVAPIQWYPGTNAAWQINASRQEIRRTESLKRLHDFLVSESEVGNIARQEAVSMVPVLMLDVHPGMRVLDMCAAPGSKTAQIIEAATATPTAKRDSVQSLQDTTLVVANDADAKRAHMLVHQTKRLLSSSLVVTSHDAARFPLLRDPKDNSPIYFDRVLADVPCSGDGTLRKNPIIWRSWTPHGANALHPVQLRILMRALRLVNPNGGRVVYSTCSLNPVENEAVVAAALLRCGGNVRLVASQGIPRLSTRPGVASWKVSGVASLLVDGKRIRAPDCQEFPLFDTFADAEAAGAAGRGKGKGIMASMFPPSSNPGASELHLERCMRIYPHLQNTGGFFVAVLEKTGTFDDFENTAQPAPAPAPAPAAPPKSKSQPKSKCARNSEQDTDAASTIARICDSAAQDSKADLAEEHEQEIEREHEHEHEHEKQDNDNVNDDDDDDDEDRANTMGVTSRFIRGRYVEEPFLFVKDGDAEIEKLVAEFKLPPQFAQTYPLVVRSTAVEHRTIYITSRAVRSFLTARGAERLKVIMTGLKLFVKATESAPTSASHRLSNEAVGIIGDMIQSGRAVHLEHGVSSLRILLEHERPQFAEFEAIPHDAQALKAAPLGGIAICVKTTTIAAGKTVERKQWIAAWRAPTSVSLLINKQERRSLLYHMRMASELKLLP